MKKIYVLLICLLALIKVSFAQYVQHRGSMGADNISGSINTYYPPVGLLTLSAGSTSVALDAVPPTDPYGNKFATFSVSNGDLLLIIQMQDAAINYANSNLYGSGSATSSPDGLGGTGYTSLGNSGKFEYVIATSSVPLTGGTLTFKGAGAGNGTVYTYVNAAATATRGQKTFQIVRVPQYSNLTLAADITAPPFNGKVGGIIAFDVAGNMDLMAKK